MFIEIKRYRFTAWGVDGTLWVDGVHVCDTVEHPQKYMSAGCYNVRMIKDEKLKRYLPKLSSGATIRPGNGPFALKKGSVAVGEYLMPGVVVKSSQAVASLCTRIKNQLARHAKVTLKIDGEEHGELRNNAGRGF